MTSTYDDVPLIGTLFGGDAPPTVAEVDGATPPTVADVSPDSGTPMALHTTPAASPAPAPAPVEPWQVPLTDEEQKALQTHPRANLSAYNVDSVSGSPRSTRQIANFSQMSRTNQALMQATGTTTPVICGTHAAPAMTGVDYLRLGWSAYQGVLFGTEPGVEGSLIVSGPEATAVTEAPAPVRRRDDEPLIRPNGMVYIPRKIQQLGGSHYDTKLLRDAFENRIPVLLHGKPGTGKTAMAEAVLPGLITLSGTADTETADFLGSYVQNPDGTFEWIDGPLIRAMEHGIPFFIDEVALIDSRVMALVYSVMDGRDELHVTTNPKRGTVKAKDGFYVVGACNPDVPGAVMSDALLSRFVLKLEVTTDYDMLSTLDVPRNIIAVAKNLAKQAKKRDIQSAPQTRELLAYTKISKTLGQDVALANLAAGALPIDREAYETVLSNAFGTTVRALQT